MSFTRGLPPKESMGIGREGILKEINGILVNEGFNPKFTDCNVVISINKGKYKILKTNIIFDGKQESKEKDLIKLLLKLKESFRKHGIYPHWTSFQKVTSTFANRIVLVQPMSEPLKSVHYLDYTHKSDKK